jgi:hypothetical protein
MTEPTQDQIWSQVFRSLIAQHTRGKTEAEIFTTIEAHQFENCTRQDCFMCRVESDFECMRHHTEPRGSELLC